MHTACQNEFGIVIVGHGTRDPDGVREFEELVALTRERCGGRMLTRGFVELTQPTIGEAIRENVCAGSQKIVVLPGLLLAAGHAKEDIPAEIDAARREFPSVEIRCAQPLGLHPFALEVMREKIADAEARSGKIGRRSETCLVVAARGSSDAEANSDAAKLARMLEQTMGFGASLVCFAAAAKPSLDEGLALAARPGISRVVMAPFILSTGFVVNQIRSACAEFSKAHADMDVLIAGHLGPHPRLADALLERAAAAVQP